MSAMKPLRESLIDAGLRVPDPSGFVHADYDEAEDTLYVRMQSEHVAVVERLDGGV